MSKKLEKIFNPRSIAIIGANPNRKSVGWGLVKNALEGKNYRKIFCVNPYEKSVLGLRCYPKITDIKEEIDLVIVAVRAKIVPQIVKECSQKKVGGIIVISSGFSESGKKGKVLEEKIKKIVRESGIPLIGPNCLGILRPSINLNASFAPASPKKGNIGFISQSGALLDSVIDKSLLENYGFSTLISYGNEADVNLNDFLEWLEKDKETKVIALYLEGIKDGRKFISTCQRISRKKPIIVLKSGREKIGKEAVSSHTGALAGDYQIFKAASRKAGVILVDTVEELFDLAKALSFQPSCRNGVGVVTNGGACGVLLSDYCEELGIKLTKLKKSTIKEINNSPFSHPSWSKRNPVDIVGDALSQRYKVAIEALLKQRDIFGLIVVQTLQIMTEVKKNAKIIVEAKKKWPEKAIITVFLGGKITKEGIDILEKNRIPNYSDLRKAAKVMRNLIKSR